VDGDGAGRLGDRFSVTRVDVDLHQVAESKFAILRENVVKLSKERLRFLALLLIQVAGPVQQILECRRQRRVGCERGTIPFDTEYRRTRRSPVSRRRSFRFQANQEHFRHDGMSWNNY
jgi:hypothetical protein